MISLLETNHRTAIGFGSARGQAGGPREEPEGTKLTAGAGETALKFTHVTRLAGDGIAAAAGFNRGSW
jgi:hypothetical protein